MYSNKLYFDGTNLYWNGKAILQNGIPISGYVPISQPNNYLNESQNYQAIFSRYFESTNEYFEQYQVIKKSRSVEKLVS